MSPVCPTDSHPRPTPTFTHSHTLHTPTHTDTLTLTHLTHHTHTRTLPSHTHTPTHSHTHIHTHTHTLTPTPHAHTPPHTFTSHPTHPQTHTPRACTRTHPCPTGTYIPPLHTPHPTPYPHAPYPAAVAHIPHILNSGPSARRAPSLCSGPPRWKVPWSPEWTTQGRGGHSQGARREGLGECGRGAPWEHRRGWRCKLAACAGFLLGSRPQRWAKARQAGAAGGGCGLRSPVLPPHLLRAGRGALGEGGMASA